MRRSLKASLITLLAMLAICEPLLAQESSACTGPTSRDPAWSPDGSQIVFTSNRTGNYELWVVDVAGGEARRLTSSASDEFYPFFSPDGARVAFTAMEEGGQQVAVVDAADGRVETLTRLEEDAADPSWLADGRLVYSSAPGGDRDLWVFEADGSDARKLFSLEGVEWAPRISPGGDRIVFHSDREGNFEVYIANLDGGDLQNLSLSPGFDGVPSWSPDGGQVAFYSRAQPESDAPDALRRSWATAEIRVVAAAGGSRRQLTDNAYRDQSPNWSPDGRTIAYTSCASGNREVWLMDVEGGNARRLTWTQATPPTGDER